MYCPDDHNPTPSDVALLLDLDWAGPCTRGLAAAVWMRIKLIN
jgi:hypothetical protein